MNMICCRLCPAQLVVILLLINAAVCEEQQKPLGDTLTPEQLEQIDKNLLRILKPTSRSTHDTWMDLHEEYVDELADNKDQDYTLLVYGDSITEAFRSRAMGQEIPRFKENKAAWQQLVASKGKAAVFSISGDKAMHLLWRLKNKGGPAVLANQPKAVMVLIGTNDVGHMANLFRATPMRAVRTVFLGVRTVLEEVAAQAPSARLIVLALPPMQPGLGQAESDKFFQWVVDKVNGELEAWAAVRGAVFSDCTAVRFLVPGSKRAINASLVPDGIHPMGPGGRVLGECVAEVLDRALAAPRKAAGGGSRAGGGGGASKGAAEVDGAEEGGGVDGRGAESGGEGDEFVGEMRDELEGELDGEAEGDDEGKGQEDDAM